MRVLKKDKLYSKIIDKLIQIDKLIILDNISDIYNDDALKKDFSKYFKGGDNKGFKLIPDIIANIIKRDNSWVEMFDKIIKRNAAYLDNSVYLNLSQEKLAREFVLHRIPSLANGDGIAPEMLILYYYAKRQFAHPDLPFLISKYKKDVKEIENTKETLNKQIKLDGLNLNDSFLEAEINLFIEEKEVVGFPDDDYFFEKAKENGFTYNPKDKTVTVPRGLILFIFKEIDILNKIKKDNNIFYNFLSKNIYRLNKYIDNVQEKIKTNKDLKDENERLRRKTTLLNNKCKKLDKIVNIKKKQSQTSLEKENEKLKKDLYYSQTRIEQLEQEIADLQQEKTINEEIEENITIIEEVKKAQIPAFLDIIISGGNWNSKTKEEVINYFADNDCSVEFIEAEKTIRKQDRIKNADLIIFDVSRHAHKYYFLIKELNKNVLHINKSNLEEITKAVE